MSRRRRPGLAIEFYGAGCWMRIRSLRVVQVARVDRVYRQLAIVERRAARRRR